LTRVAARSASGADASEANSSVVEAQLRDFKPLSTQQRRPFIQADTRNADVVAMVVGAVRTLSPPNETGAVPHG
jgi:uncharacterized protein